jgi:pyruvate-ferredoxin/flavodoxin oxidoreductase
MQSAFFKVAGIIPEADAMKYMKQAVEKAVKKADALLMAAAIILYSLYR